VHKSVHACTHIQAHTQPPTRTAWPSCTIAAFKRAPSSATRMASACCARYSAPASMHVSGQGDAARAGLWASSLPSQQSVCACGGGGGGVERRAKDHRSDTTTNTWSGCGGPACTHQHRKAQRSTVQHDTAHERHELSARRRENRVTRYTAIRTAYTVIHERRRHVLAPKALVRTVKLCQSAGSCIVCVCAHHSGDGSTGTPSKQARGNMRQANQQSRQRTRSRLVGAIWAVAVVVVDGISRDGGRPIKAHELWEARRCETDATPKKRKPSVAESSDAD